MSCVGNLLANLLPRVFTCYFMLFHPLFPHYLRNFMAYQFESHIFRIARSLSTWHPLFQLVIWPMNFPYRPELQSIWAPLTSQESTKTPPWMSAMPSLMTGSIKAHGPAMWSFLLLQGGIQSIPPMILGPMRGCGSCYTCARAKVWKP